jgi:signal transduction protein with GAF and PtsI domain
MDKIVERYYQELYEVAAVLNSARDPQAVLHAIVALVAKAVGAKGCSLMLLTPDRKVLLHTAAYGLSDWYVRKGPVSADKSISQSLTRHSRNQRGLLFGINPL